VLPGREGGRVAMPQGWSQEPITDSACGRVPPAEAGLAASPPGDFTVVLRALRWPVAVEDLPAAVRACGGRADGYAGRFDRLGVAIEARGVLVQREGRACCWSSRPRLEDDVRRGAARPLGPRGGGGAALDNR